MYEGPTLENGTLLFSVWELNTKFHVTHMIYVGYGYISQNLSNELR